MDTAVYNQDQIQRNHTKKQGGYRPITERIKYFNDQASFEPKPEIT